MRYYKKRTYRKNYKKRNYTWGSVARERAKKNLRKLIKETVASETEKKQISNVLDKSEGNAAQLLCSQLTDIPTGQNNNSRIGNEIVGDHFDILYNAYNKTNNDLYVRVALVELEGRGATEDITAASNILQDPNGDVVSYTTAVAVADNAAVMWPYDNKGSCTILKEKVIHLAKFNSGNNGSSRTIRWKVPWNKKIRFLNPDNQGALMQSKRVTLVTTAWSPAGGDQSTYTYDLDAMMRFFYKDS